MEKTGYTAFHAFFFQAVTHPLVVPLPECPGQEAELIGITRIKEQAGSADSPRRNLFLPAA